MGTGDFCYSIMVMVQKVCPKQASMVEFFHRFHQLLFLNLKLLTPGPLTNLNVNILEKVVYGKTMLKITTSLTAY